MKLQEFYKLLCVIYAQDIYKAEQYKHLIDYIEHEKAKAFNTIEEEEKEQDIFIAFAIFKGIERAIYKSLPDFMQYHEQWHNRIKEQGKVVVDDSKHIFVSDNKRTRNESRILHVYFRNVHKRQGSNIDGHR